MTILGGALVASTLARPLAFTSDDSLFYVVIGEHIASGDGATFNGIIPTNGFQPLWGLVVALTVGVAGVLGFGSPIGLVRSVVLVGWLLLALGLWVFRRLLERLGVGAAGQVIALVVVLAYLAGWRSTVASEANLVFLLLVSALTMVTGLTDGASARPTERQLLWTGALLGLLMLARLDTVFTAGSALIAILVVGRGCRSDRFRAVAAVGATAAALVVPYLVWSHWRFGSVMPIPADIKVDRSTPTFSAQSIGPSGWAIAALAMASAGFALIVLPRARRVHVVWLVPLVGGLTATAYYFIWSVGPLTDLDWYRVPQVAAAAAALGLGVGHLASTRRQIQPLVLLGSVVVLVGLVGIHWGLRMQGEHGRHWDRMEAVSREVGQEVDEGERIATVDYPGMLALFSGRDVLALDGLTGDRHFQDDLRDLGAPCALGRLGVDWLVVEDAGRLEPVTGSRGEEWTIEVSSWLHRRPAGELTVRTDDLHLVDDPTGLRLWRWSEPCPRADPSG